MTPDLSRTLLWSLGLAVVAVAYGHHVGARQAQGRPLTLKEQFRNFLILHAIGVGIVGVMWFQSLPMLPVRVRNSMLRPLAALALGPIALWWGFDLPLRLTRHLTRRRPAADDAPHPLDGAWPRAASFLDAINAHRSPTPGAADCSQPSDRPSSPALDRVARLRPLDSRTGDQAR